jgi:hypothetical protein
MEAFSDFFFNTFGRPGLGTADHKVGAGFGALE